MATGEKLAVGGLGLLAALIVGEALAGCQPQTASSTSQATTSESVKAGSTAAVDTASAVTVTKPQAPTTTVAATPPPAPAPAPAPVFAPAPAPAPAAPSGYKAGQFCKVAAEGTTTIATNGATIKCIDVDHNGHPHWEPV